MSSGVKPGRHALVTGGSRGIGAAIARRLVADGHRVTILDVRLEGAQQLATKDPEHLHAVAADITSEQQVQAAVADANQRFGRVDILVNNAGMASSAPFLKMDLALWQRMLDVNLTGTMLCTHAVLPAMVEAGWGRIVNIASTAGKVGYAYVTAYVAAKHGVVGLTRALALEMAKKGVTVNAVCPGYANTDLVKESIRRVVAKTGRSEESALEEFIKVNPQHRLVEPVEVADTVAWLCGENTGAVTGQSVSVSGGEVMP
ncbi:MAG TPA: SDR family NAD(P)-dependent oxidoreductase [Nevskiaceae bacterium]